MKMKTKRKALLLSLCAVLLVVASVMGTMAYLTSTDSVENTFTVGKVEITLDEKDTDNSTPNADRDKANSYLLVPGEKYEKDPTVHVKPVSENSYIFVKVENELSAFEAATSTEEGGYKSIADQIEANNWTLVKDTTNVYWKSYTKGDTANANLVVFENFKIADDANGTDGWDEITAVEGNENTGAKITVTAYAVQQEGFATAEEAWTNTFGKPATNP